MSQKLFDQLHPSWQAALHDQRALLDSIERKLIGRNFLPDQADILRSLSYDLNSAKVLILGQDPYPNSIDAMGLAFSSKRQDGKFPGSLKNIYKELASDLAIDLPQNSDLSPWCEKGVVLLNRLLTCEVGISDSHKSLGWEAFTEEAVKVLAKREIVAILWGTSAAKVSHHFSPERVITSVHPSPLSAHRGFFGTKPFSRANELLAKVGASPIDWAL